MYPLITVCIVEVPKKPNRNNVNCKSEKDPGNVLLNWENDLLWLYFNTTYSSHKTRGKGLGNVGFRILQANHCTYGTTKWE